MIVESSKPMQLASYQIRYPYAMMLLGFAFLFALSLMCFGQEYTGFVKDDFSACLMRTDDAVINWQTQRVAEAGYRRNMI